MSGGLSAGLATFASCNKAGSIPQFTAYLQVHPHDYTALTWRGRAYSITGKNVEAIADFQEAAKYGTGPQKYLAESQCAFLQGDETKGATILINAIKNYPTCAEAWSELGTMQFYQNMHDEALSSLKKSIDLGKQNTETNEPWYPWANNHVGDIYYSKHDVDNAESYYNTAVSKSDTFTIAHLGISKCSIIKKDLLKAENSFNRAKTLNPTLVHWARFGDFKRSVEEAYGVTTTAGNLQPNRRYEDDSTGVAYPFQAMSLASRSAQRNRQRYSTSSGGRGGQGGNGNRGGGNGSGSSDDEGDDDYTVWKQIKARKPETYRHLKDGRTFIRIGRSKYFLSRDKAGHGGSFCKVYIEKGNTFDFLGSVLKEIFRSEIRRNPSKLKEVITTGPLECDFCLIPKQESRAGTQILKKDLKCVQ